MSKCIEWILEIQLSFVSQTVNLTFGFPFYGHVMKHVFISTAGKCVAKLNKVSVFSLTHKATLQYGRIVLDFKTICYINPKYPDRLVH